ncbi:MAG: hypothetical protein K9G71_13500 [Rhodobacteraceae bacterium]|nr:hypothetical protein [Paracoccaceae bacterium]MCF8515532.1 hypothetical protein [Paracoccaceae bacterium]MCF8519777.1 hypothetical protein [Paracoccaceae bacterium]
MNIVEQQAGWGAPPVKVRRSRVRLDSASDCRREAARQYRRALEGEIKIEDMSRLINAVALIGRMIEGGELEKRIEALEGAM